MSLKEKRINDLFEIYDYYNNMAELYAKYIVEELNNSNLKEKFEQKRLKDDIIVKIGGVEL